VKTLIIDNYDSFTYIIKQYIGELGGKPEVFFNDEISIARIKKIQPTHIVLSPGPGTAEKKKDRGIMMELIKAFHKNIPILGICLGHQAIARFFDGKIVQSSDIMHGKRSNVFHNQKKIFHGVQNPLKVMRYHSLAVDPRFWLASDSMNTIAYTSDFTIMGIQHKQYPVFGIQFHPESLGTPEGKKILRNFLKTK